MGWWNEQVVPRATDLSLRGHEVGELRARACEGLHGRVIEIGFGSGLNARWYPSTVTQVDVVEPSEVAWRMSADRRLRAAAPVGRIGIDGQQLNIGAATFDAALVTFTLCTIPDVEAALSEIRRVLKPGASLHFLEHGIADDPKVVAWQRRLEPIQRRLAGGCHLTRDPVILIEKAGLPIHTVEQVDLPGGPKPFRSGFLGVALKA
jgi:ubiquinone/menaquinone biosynthesis C-methylase UbiE